MKFQVDIITIDWLRCQYIISDVQVKTGILKKGTKTVEKKIGLDIKKMIQMNYPKHVIEYFRVKCKRYPPSESAGVAVTQSVEYTVKKFIKENNPKEIISIIKDDISSWGETTLCIVWEKLS